MTRRVVERELRDARGSFLRDDLEAFDDAWYHDVLESRVEVLGVLTHDHEIDVLELRGHAGQVPDRSKVGIQVERLAEPYVDAREPMPDGRRHRSLERDLVAADRLEELVRERLAVLLEGDHARDVAVPFDRYTRCIEDSEDRFGDFRPDAVARDEGDGVFHALFASVPVKEHETETKVERHQER